MPTFRSDDPAPGYLPEERRSGSGEPAPGIRNDREDLTDLLARTLRSGKPGILHVRGTSMLPTLPEGTRVRVDPVPPERIGIGRIAVFRKKDLLVVHRLIWKRCREGTAHYLFKGDNSGVLEKVTAEDILGVVNGWEPPGTSSGSGKAGFRPIPLDSAYRFYHLAFFFLGPVLRFAGFLTGGYPRFPHGRFRRFLKRCHSGVESVLFRQRPTP